jgi:hypothetical protein
VCVAKHACYYSVFINVVNYLNVSIIIKFFVWSWDIYLYKNKQESHNNKKIIMGGRVGLGRAS